MVENKLKTIFLNEKTGAIFSVAVSCVLDIREYVDDRVQHIVEYIFSRISQKINLFVSYSTEFTHKWKKILTSKFKQVFFIIFIFFE